MLVRGRTSRLPGHNEVRYIRGGVATPPPRKAQATMNCRAPVVCLVTVPVSCLDTVAVLGGETPRTPPSSTGCLLSHSTCIVFGHSNRAGGGDPSGTPPSSTPLGAGSQILSRAWTQQMCRGGTPPGPPPSSTPPRAGTHIYLLILKKRRGGGEQNEKILVRNNTQEKVKCPSLSSLAIVPILTINRQRKSSTRYIRGEVEGIHEINATKRRCITFR